MPRHFSRTRTVRPPSVRLDSWRRRRWGGRTAVLPSELVGWDHDVRRQDPRDRHHGLLAALPRHLHRGLHDRRRTGRRRPTKQKKKVTELSSKNQRPDSRRSTPRRRTWSKAQAEHKAAIDAARTDQVAARGRHQDGRRTRSPRPATKLETAQQNAKTALDEAERPNARRPTQLREQKSAVEKQANEFKLQQTELNDKIRELERQLETRDEQRQRPPRPRRPVLDPAAAARASPTTSPR